MRLGTIRDPEKGQEQIRPEMPRGDTKCGGTLIHSDTTSVHIGDRQGRQRSTSSQRRCPIGEVEVGGARTHSLPQTPARRSLKELLAQEACTVCVWRGVLQPRQP